eukprot:3435286-Amphidinium_carterae.3
MQIEMPSAEPTGNLYALCELERLSKVLHNPVGAAHLMYGSVTGICGNTADEWVSVRPTGADAHPMMVCGQPQPTVAESLFILDDLAEDRTICRPPNCNKLTMDSARICCFIRKLP